MDSQSSVRRPLRCLLILTLCLGGLAFHLLAENLGPSGWSAVVERAEHGGDIDPTHETQEDTFVVPTLGHSDPLALFMPIGTLMALFFSSIHVSPLLPPPN